MELTIIIILSYAIMILLILLTLKMVLCLVEFVEKLVQLNRDIDKRLAKIEKELKYGGMKFYE